MQKLVHSQDETMLADAARGFLDAAAPVSHLRALRDAGHTHDAALWQEMASMGWSGVLIPEAQGGSDMGHAAAGIIAGALGTNLAATPFISTAVIAATALRNASSTRADAMLEKIVQGEVTYALAIDETRKFKPEATQMRADPDGNGFLLTGRKQFVVDGGFADRALVLARSKDGLTLFDLPMDRFGITRTATRMIDSRDAATLEFTAIAATGDDIVGTVHDAMAVLGPALAAGQAALAAEMSGVAAGAFGMTAAYLNERKQFGVKIGSFQALAHRAAHLWCEIEVTTSAVLNAARCLDDTPAEAGMAVSLAKARGITTAQLAVMEGVQMHGGIGMTDAYDMGLFMKRARVCAEWLGDYGYHAENVARLRGF